MNRTDCSNVRREIEEAGNGEGLAAASRDHLRNCAACAAFDDEQQKLKDMVASLGTVKAPADFDFKLRARLATARSSRRSLSAGNGFGLRSVAFASLLLLVGLVVVLMNVRSGTNQSASVIPAPASQPSIETAQVKTPPQHNNAAPMPSEVVAASPTNTIDAQTSPATLPQPRPKQGSTSQYVARNGRIKATDLSVTAAPVFRPGETVMGSSVFPLGTSYQSLKVSVDDGRGSKRTISLPTVSFGSSRALAQNPAPIMASTRDSW